MYRKLMNYVGPNLRMPWWLFWAILFANTWFYLIRRVISWDLWWHMAAGRYLVENFAYPPMDYFTFSPLSGSAFTSKTWFGDIIFYGIYEWFGGFYGLQIFRAACILAPVLFMLKLSKWRYNIWTLLAATMMIIGTMQKHLIKNAIIILPAMGFISWTWIQIKFHKKYYWIYTYPFLFLFWTVFHGSAIYGLVLLGLILAGEIIDSFVIPFLGKISWKKVQWAFQDMRIITTMSVSVVVLYLSPTLGFLLTAIVIFAASTHEPFKTFFKNAEEKKSHPKMILTLLASICICAIPVHINWGLPFHTVNAIAAKFIPALNSSSSASSSTKTAAAPKQQAQKSLKERLKEKFRTIFTGTDAQLVAEYQWPFEILYVLSVKALFMLAIFYAIHLLLKITLGWQHLSFSLELPSFALLYVAMGYLRTVSYPFVVAMPFMAYGMMHGLGSLEHKRRKIPGIILLCLCCFLTLSHFASPLYHEFNALFYNALGYAKILAIPYMFLPLILGAFFLIKKQESFDLSLKALSVSLGIYTLGCLAYFSYFQNKTYKEGNFHSVSGFLDTEPGLGKSNKFFDGMANYVQENLPPKNIYNTYNMGGYLQWMWYGERKVFIDGRSAIFDFDFYQAYTQNNAQAYIQKNDFEHALLNMLVDKDRLQLFLRQGWTPIAFDPGMAVLQRPKQNIQDVYGVVPTYQEGECSIADMENLDRQALGGFINMTIHHMMLFGRIADGVKFMKLAEPVIQQLIQPELIQQLMGRKNHVERIASAFGEVNHPLLGKLCEKLFNNVQGYDLHMAMGNTYRALQQWQKAEIEYSQAYNIKKDNKDHLLFFGEVLFMQKKHQRALMAYQEAINIDNKDPRLHNAAALALLATDQLDKALMAGQNAIRLNPNFFEAYYNLALVHEKRKEIPRALNAAKQALQINSNFTQAQEVIKRLETATKTP
jgi:tetratricopeptide (TPR) repeat protein